MIYKNKKASSFLDGLTILGFLILIGFLGIVIYDVFGDINTDIQNDDSFDNTSKERIDDLYDRFPSWLDGAFAFILVGLWIVTLVFAFLIDSHPVFFIVGIILIIIALMLAGIFTNTYEEWVASEEIAGLELNFPIMNFIMKHLLETILVIVASIIIVLYGKSRSSI